MINFSKKIISTIFLLLISTNSFAGLLPDTKVFVGNNRYKKVKELKAGSSIVVYSIHKHEIEERDYQIKKISTRKTRELILIETDSEQILFGPNQKVYNRRIHKFISAKDFKAGDKLFSPDKGNLTVKKVSRERLPNKIALYDLAIENGNLFLIQTENKTNILVHNFALTVPILTWTFGEGIAWLGLGTLLAAVGTAATDFVLEEIFHKKNKKRNKGKKKPEFDAQAPGEPTREDGYRTPKRWDGKRARHPRTGQYGYPDNKGKVWVPTGPGSAAHGGPHWDVIDKRGNHTNVLPGGRIRGQK